MVSDTTALWKSNWYLIVAQEVQRKWVIPKKPAVKMHKSVKSVSVNFELQQSIFCGTQRALFCQFHRLMVESETHFFFPILACLIVQPSNIFVYSNLYGYHIWFSRGSAALLDWLIACSMSIYSCGQSIADVAISERPLLFTVWAQLRLHSYQNFHPQTIFANFCG